MLITKNSTALIDIFEQGGVIAYPTEGVYGLGCAPDNEDAVMRLLKLKQRPVNKGLILVAHDFSQVQKYLKALDHKQQKCAKPSAITYLYPTLNSAPKWLTGDFDSLAVRISEHPLVRELCQMLDSAVVSTSANLAGAPPAMSADEVAAVFKDEIDAILDGPLGGSQKPSEIRDSISGKLIRA